MVWDDYIRFKNKKYFLCQVPLQPSPCQRNAVTTFSQICSTDYYFYHLDVSHNLLCKNLTRYMCLGLAAA